MRQIALFAVLLLGLLIAPGCQPATATTQPSITTAIVTIAERFALGYAQQALNQAYTSGKVTRAQYDAAETILVKLPTDLNAGGGTLTQVQVDDLINKALADAAIIYIPITPIGPMPTAGAAPAKAGMWVATPVSGWKQK